MAFADELRNNYDSKQKTIQFLKLGTDTIISSVLNYAKKVSSTNHSIEGFFSYSLKENDYKLTKQSLALSAFDMFDGSGGHTLNFLKLEDFGVHEAGFIESLRHRGMACEEVCAYTTDQIETAVQAIRNGLVKEGFSNVEVSYRKIGTQRPICGYRKQTFLEAFKPATAIDWYDGGTDKVAMRVDMPCYGVYISMSW